MGLTQRRSRSVALGRSNSLQSERRTLGSGGNPPVDWADMNSLARRPLSPLLVLHRRLRSAEVARGRRSGDRCATRRCRR